MEYRNYYNTPRDMVGDEMLSELLRENEPQWNGKNYRSGESRRGRNYEEMPNVNIEYDKNRVRTPNCRGEYQAVSTACMENKWVNPRLEGNPLAMVYSPHQEWECLYEVEEALRRGTLFKKLDFDFWHGCCSR